MDFLLWAARSLHVFAVVVWLGGLTYQSAVTLTVARVEGAEFSPQLIHTIRRSIPFVWMSVWTVLVTGVVMTLFSPRFILFEFHDSWSVLLALKQVTFLLMLLFSAGFARMFARVEEFVKTGVQKTTKDDPLPYYHRMVQFGRINIVLGIMALLLAEGMR